MITVPGLSSFSFIHGLLVGGAALAFFWTFGGALGGGGVAGQAPPGSSASTALDPELEAALRVALADASATFHDPSVHAAVQDVRRDVSNLVKYKDDQAVMAAFSKLLEVGVRPGAWVGGLGTGATGALWVLGGWLFDHDLPMDKPIASTLCRSRGSWSACDGTHSAAPAERTRARGGAQRPVLCNAHLGRISLNTIQSCLLRPHTFCALHSLVSGPRPTQHPPSH